MTTAVANAAPVNRKNRIVAIDVLRGFAVLGILVMNIQSFSMISAAYLNPAANDKLLGAGFWVWAVSHLFADLKFMALFSMLFGAGIVLMTSRAEEGGAKVTGLHYKRNFWLLVLGLAHAHLLWYGDILVPYALTAFILFWLRKVSPPKLLALGFATMSVAFFIFLSTGLSIPDWPAEVKAEEVIAWAPSPEVIAEETAAYRGGYMDHLPVRSAQALAFEVFVFPFFLGWRIAGLMMIGMALFKLGVFSAERSIEFYRRLAIFGFGAGLPVIAIGIELNVRENFSFEYSFFHGSLWNYVGSIGVALGYVGLVMLAVKKGWLAAFQTRLAATGRMAFTNYLTQSIICTLIFYGHGLGLFESVGRAGQIGIVLAVWVVQLLWSPWWLARYRFGPAEWLWRTLTYGQRQPFKRA